MKRTEWIKMPAPENCRDIKATEGPGMYLVRNIVTGEKVLFGIGESVQKRMKSLFPKPYGTGTRNASDKREYILMNYKDLEYQVWETKTREHASILEKAIKSHKDHMFNR